MKLHLNLSLRRALLAAMAAVSTLPTAWAGVMHDDATLQTYADFGQNRGRYVVGSQVNALLAHIREEEGGIAITYTDGDAPYVISNEQGMINFAGTHDSGHSAMISPTFLATVLHNGSLDGSFSERTVGSGYAINYEAIDIRGSVLFRLAPDNGNGEQYDYMLQRQSKVVTDVTWNPLTTLSTDDVGDLGGQLLYHSGSGTKYMWNSESGTSEFLCGASSYIVGSVNTVSSGQVHEDGSNLSLHVDPEFSAGGEANESYPLPLGPKSGDSGSPTYIYNTATGQYEYVAAMQSAGLAADNTYSQARGNVEWTASIMESFNERVDMSNTATVYLNAVDTESGTISDAQISTTLYTGKATDAAGNILGEYTGVQTRTNTWCDLSDRKNLANWYAYQKREVINEILGTTRIVSDLNVSDADLFYTENLVFTPTQAENSIILNDTVDLGIGYAEFNKGENMEKAVFTITAAEGSGAMFNHAGYVINQGAEVHVKLNNSADYMTEWRKTGAGDLYIDGSGDTNALLNVGGSGSTYLQQSDGHAAYNVLASSGATVVISDTGQIERDFTFGAGGGTLDMNGNRMDWYTTGGESREGSFTINALTEEAMITNTAGQATLTYMESGNTTFAGSFRDSATGSLSIVYAGGGTWTLNSIHTNLMTWANSSFRVSSGKVILSGTHTVHGLGSATGTNPTRYTNADDWHYADAAMIVEIDSGATFELGSHARLTGQVYVNGGGTFILREGVTHQYEYVEGGATPEDTYQYSDYYGFHGIGSDNDIYLADSTATLKIEYSEGTTANTTLDASISGKGAVTIAAGTTGGTLTLSGVNSSMSGTKELISGGLIATRAEALGDTGTNKWKVQEKAWIASQAESGADLLNKLDSSSTGVLALSADTEGELDLTGHQGLYIGAEKGKTINYGTAEATLAAVNGQWKLGGGEGTLNVLFQLTGQNNLIIGNEYSSGTVHLTNTDNDFTGDIFILGTGNILTYEEGALGNARVALTYGNTLALHQAGELAILKDGAQGVLAATSSTDLDMTGCNAALGATGDVTFTGNLTVGDKYRFGGSGNLTLDTGLNSSASMEIDGQGNSGSSVTFARENAYSGSIVASGGMYLAEPNSSGSVGIHAGHSHALAALSSLQLQKGATLYTDDLPYMTVQNLSAESGAAITNNGSQAATLELRVTDGQATTIADGVLSDSSAALTLVKTGKGTLSLSGNSSWSGGMTIREGTVSTHAGNGGIGSASNAIHIEEGGCLRVEAAKVDYIDIGKTIINQTLTGNGTIVAASGGNMLLTQKNSGFEGTVLVTENTRLYVGSGLTYYRGSENTYNNVQAFDNATIQVTDGSQVRVTNTLVHVSDQAIVSTADYIIAGSGMAKPTSYSLVHEDFVEGALSIDCGSTIRGNVTLAADATIASWSLNTTDGLYNGVLNNIYGRYLSLTEYTAGLGQHYGVKNCLGGTIRGLILGEGKTLSLAGTEGITITADSANTYGDLVIANANGNNDDKFALRLDGGKAVSQTSTALGTGEVTLNDGLILRLAGTGTANQTDVTYTYANNITAGNNATLESHNITNRLTGSVTMTGSSLNLATANGGVLDLAGGISGSGTLNVAAGSKVLLGAITSTAETPSFAISAGAGADITLNSSNLISGTTISGTDSLTLRLGGAEDYTFDGISLSGSGTTGLTLSFDFTHVPDAEEAATWSTLYSDISAGSTVVEIALNDFNDIKSGTYILASGTLGGSYTLADTLDGRLSLSSEGGTLQLTVGEDNRLYWASDGVSQNWNNADANWYRESSGGNVSFSDDSYVVLDSTGTGDANSAENRETITLDETRTISTLAAKDDGAYYEVTGTGTLTGDKLVVGNQGDLKLSIASATLTNGVQVDNAALEVSGTRLTASIALKDASLTLDQATVEGNITAAGTGQLHMNQAQLGSHSFSTDSGATLSMSNATLSGELSWTQGNSTLTATTLGISAGSITTNAGLQAGSVSIASGSSLNISGEHAVTIDTITGSGALNIQAGSTATLNLGNATLGSLDLLGGTTNISGTVNLGSARLSMGKATLNLNNGASVTTTHFRSGDQANEQPSHININQGATLTITGSTNTDDTDTSFLLAHWKSCFSTMVLNGGTLTAGNTSMLMGWDSGGAFTALSGEATLKGIRFSAQRSNADTFTLGTATEGSARLNIGSDGITGIGNNDTVSLGEGTIRATADFAISGESVSFIGSQNGTVLDTAGHTITIDSGTNGSGKVEKTGAGVLKLDGTGFSGAVEVTEGSLALGKADAATTLAGLSIRDNATLDLSSIDFSQSGITLANGAVFSFAESSTIDLGDLQEGTTYSIFDLSAGGQLSGWETMTAANFTVGGNNLEAASRVELQLGVDGSFFYTLNSLDLIWSSGESGKWTEGVWKTGSSDAETPTAFDTTIFANDATVTLDADIAVSGLEVQAGRMVTLQNPGTRSFSVGTVVVEAGAHLKLQYTNSDDGGKTGINRMELGNEATMSTYNGNAVTEETHIGTLVLNGASATLKDEHHSGYISVGTLSMGSGVASALLSLEKASDSQNCTVFEFGAETANAGNFAGTIELKSISESPYARPAVILLSGENAAKSAIISLVSNASGADNSIIGLGINSSNARIAGLESSAALGARAVLFSGSIAANKAWATGNIDGSAGNTLTIEAAADKTHTFRGNVVNSINLVKDGSGTQEFLGTGSFTSITVNGGTLTLGGSMGMTTSNLYTIAEGALLNFNSSAAFSSGSKQTKDGAGRMVISSRTALSGMLETKGGEIELAYTGEEGNSIARLDGAMTGGTTAQGTLKLAENVKLVISGDIWTRSNTGILLEKGAELDLGSRNMTIRNEGSTEARFGASTSAGQQYSLSNTYYEIRNARVTNTAGGTVSLSNQLVNSTVENQGDGTFTLNHTANSLTGVVASGGNVTLQSMGEAMSLNLLEIAAGKTVNAYVGINTDANSTVTVTGSALLSGTATLNTSLTLTDGAELDMTGLNTGAVTLNGALTFSGKVTMGDNLLAIVNEMSGWEESVLLFTGLDSVAIASGSLTDGDSVQAAQVFSNVGSGEMLYVTYQVIDNVGSLMVVHVPEPTTTTLSLLALSALAARRRRK